MFDHFKSIWESNRVRLGRSGFYHTSYSEKFCDIIAHYITSIFLKLKVSANRITVFELILGTIAAVIISGGNQEFWIIGLFIYAAAIQLDHIDGTVARATNTTTYFGYFLDGVSGVFLLSFIRFALMVNIYKQFGFTPLFIMAISVLFLTPFYVFMYDKYAAFARRINQERNLDIKPYIRNDFLKAPANMVVDFERIALIISIFQFSVGIWIYLIINFILEVGFIFYHLYSASKYMRISNVAMSRS